jgi:hypothetical protein
MSEPATDPYVCPENSGFETFKNRLPLSEYSGFEPVGTGEKFFTKHLDLAPTIVARDSVHTIWVLKFEVLRI